MDAAISVVIPAYNSEVTIEKSILSVISQTRYDLISEIIVIDDGSTDGTALIVDGLSRENDRIKLIKKSNGGVSSARNAGIRRSHGNWIAFLDSDDEWLPKKIEKQWEEIERRPEIRFIGCGRNYEKVKWGKRISESLYVLDLNHIQIKNWPHTSSAMIRRDVLRETGLFNEKMRYGEDGDLWNRIVVKYPIYYIPQTYEIAGGMKLQFGESGLSANLREMHKANLRNIMVLKKKREINGFFYIFLILYTNAKYIRRILLADVNHRRRNCTPIT